jgi:hypothetical protein
MKFLKSFKNGEMVYLEDSVLWYCLEMGVEWYKSLSIHQRINFKQSFFDMSERLYKEIKSINY